MRYGCNAARVLLGLAFLLVPHNAQAAPIQVEPASQLLLETSPTLQAGTFDFLVSFRLDEARPTYVKVLPTTWNPAHRNGTVNESGWWTDVNLRSQSGDRYVASTNGTTVVELGTLAPNTTHEAVLRVHAPIGSLRIPHEYRMNFALAVRSEAGGSGSGGSLDPSESVAPRLVVASGEDPGVGGPGDVPGAAPSPTQYALIGVAVLAGAGIMVYFVRRPRKKLPPEEGP